MRKGQTKSRFYNHLKELGTEHFSIILIEEFKSSNIDQMKAKRQEWIDKLKPTLNQIFIDTDQQEERKIKQKERRKKWDQDNVEKTKTRPSRQKTTCECGAVIRIDSKPRHLNTKKHKDYAN